VQRLRMENKSGFGRKVIFAQRVDGVLGRLIRFINC
jgi:hypothetical protein